jgi:hypothetical protein
MDGIKSIEGKWLYYSHSIVEGGFPADVKNHSVNAADFIDDAIRSFAEQLMG